MGDGARSTQRGGEVGPSTGPGTATVDRRGATTGHAPSLRVDGAPPSSVHLGRASANGRSTGVEIKKTLYFPILFPAQLRLKESPVCAVLAGGGLEHQRRLLVAFLWGRVFFLSYLTEDKVKTRNHDGDNSCCTAASLG